MTKEGILGYPPGPKEKYPGSLLLEFRRNPIKLLMRVAQEYGRIAHIRFGWAHAFLLSDPELIKDVLVTHHQYFIKSRGLQVAKRLLGEGLLTSEFEFHHKQRRLIQPAFHHSRIATYASTMAEYAERMSGQWLRSGLEGKSLDIHREMMRLTLAIVAKTLFNADVEAEAKDVGEALTQVMENFSRLTNPLSPILDRLPLPSNKKFEEAKSKLDSIVYRMIEEHKREEKENKGSSNKNEDLLSMLLAAYEDSNGGNNREMTATQVRDEAMTLFLAGHETTANALTWTWYLLSLNPQAETRLHEELHSVLGGRTPTFDDVPKLEYTNMVITESMRLYPPAWILGRQPIKDYLAYGRYNIPAGSTVLMSQYVMHRQPDFFSDPESFKPERWTAEFKASLPKYCYFPFGAGPRSCIGEPFAWMEMILVLATIAQRWQLRHVPSHRVELLPRITLRPKYGMEMILERRGKTG